MYISATLFAIFISNYAFASASVGDFAYHTGAVVSNCGTKNTTLKSFSEINYVDEHVVKILNQQTVDGSTSYKEYSIQASDYIDGKELQDFFNLKEYCSHLNNGAMEKISVEAGTFWTCHMKSTLNDVLEETWIGGVALGVVKSKTSQSEFNDPKCMREVSWELKDFSIQN